MMMIRVINQRDVISWGCPIISGRWQTWASCHKVWNLIYSLFFNPHPISVDWKGYQRQRRSVAAEILSFQNLNPKNNCGKVSSLSPAWSKEGSSAITSGDSILSNVVALFYCTIYMTVVLSEHVVLCDQIRDEIWTHCISDWHWRLEKVSSFPWPGLRARNT